jgi:hypothetical protein
MRPFPIATIALALLGTAGTAWGQTSAQCANIADPTARLACYDRARPQQPGSGPTPSTVSKDGIPVAPEDRAFDPRRQHLTPDHEGLVVPQWRHVGVVPVRSGPGTSVPVVTLDLPRLNAVPGGRWELPLVLANNSGRAIDVRIACSFRNGDRRVSDLGILLRDIGPGERVATTVDGPPVTDFVDNVPCRIISPLE